MLAATRANEFPDMRFARRPDGADIQAARPLAVDGAIEPHLEADQRRVAEQVSVTHPAHRSFDAAANTALAASGAVLNSPNDFSSRLNASNPECPRFNTKPIAS